MHIQMMECIVDHELSNRCAEALSPKLWNQNYGVVHMAMTALLASPESSDSNKLRQRDRHRRWGRLDDTKHLRTFFDKCLEFILKLLSSRDNKAFKRCYTGVVVETLDTVKICFVRQGAEGAQANTTVEVEHRDRAQTFGWV